jgi:hypothetical protein
MKWTIKRSHSSSNSSVDINTARGKMPSSSGGAVHFMLCMQYEEDVQHPSQPRIRFVGSISPVRSVLMARYKLCTQ